MPEAIPLAVNEPAPPDLPGTVVIRPTVADLVDAAAAELAMQCLACVREFGDFHLALSGGSTPDALYRLLMYDPAYRDLPWARVHLWQVDERCVPHDDPRSNFRLLHETIVEQSAIPPEQVHPIPATDPDAAARYEEDLRACLGWRERGHDRLDYALLGMGEDGHTASLFPHSAALDESGLLVARNAGHGVTPPDRVTMTFRMLNATRLIGVLVTGQRKRSIVARVAARGGTVAELPILGIRPLAGDLRWYLDWEACPGAPTPA